ncbi:hypothetical protein GBAR_LOCUS29734 [Geodia barretti]|uniref:Uncharacterized protein n=1 Tax=Geodia barretti TaxID=519541 RepID=A0AA35XKK6_GEOBA|nr:hypothetical protein GBAR_LOCUS29734 [Geodia barretti]
MASNYSMYVALSHDLMAKMKLTLHHHYIILVQKNSDTHNVSNCFES